MINQRQRGFTLMEIIVVLFLFSVILMALFTLFDKHSQLYRYQDDLVKVSGSARSTMDALQNYTLQANRVLASQTVNGTLYTSGSSTLVLQVPTVNSSGAIVGNTYDYVAFHLSGTKLIQSIQADASSARATGDRDLSDYINTLGFTYDSGTFTSVQKVTVDLKTAISTDPHSVSYHTEGQFLLRNY